MVRKQTKIDLAWFDYTPEVLVLGQVRQVLRKYKLKVPDFDEYMKGKLRPVVEYDNGDIALGVLSEHLRRYLRSRLTIRKSRV